MKKTMPIIFALIMICLLSSCTTNNTANTNKTISNFFNNKNTTIDTINLSVNYNVLNEASIFETEDGTLYYSLGNSIYKLESNKTTPEIIYTCNKRFTSISSFAIKNGWIYFRDYNDTSASFEFKKMNLTNQDEVITICQNMPAGTIRVYNGCIYINNDYKLDEESENKLIKFYDKEAASGYTVNYINNEIYFFDSEKDVNGIFKMTIEGENKQKIFDGRADYMIVDEEWIYFQNYEDVNNGLYRMKKDGSDVQKLIGEQVHHMNKLGDWIYCNLKINDIEGIYKIKSDGSEYQLLKECEGVPYINIIEEWLYYSDDENTIRKMKLDGSEDQVFAQIEE